MSAQARSPPPGPPPERFPEFWASDWGEDPLGLWLAFTYRGVRQAFRWCPPNRFLMGSSEQELGLDDDETQHEVVLTRGYWLAETACTQALWASVTISTRIWPTMMATLRIAVIRRVWIARRRWLWPLSLPIPGAFTKCTAMSGSGVRKCERVIPASMPESRGHGWLGVSAY